MVRELKITNIYEDGGEVITHERVVLSERSRFSDESAWNDYLQDTLFKYTGTGRTSGDAGYFVESDDGLDPAISVEYC